MPPATPQVEGYYDADADADSGTVSYPLLDPASGQCALIDGVLDDDPKSGRAAMPALRVTLRGGRLPEPEANGTRYLTIPLNAA